MQDNAVELVLLRNNFYRDNYRRVVGALILMILINISLGAMIWYMIANRPTPKYFATQSDGTILPLQPLNEPNMSNNAISSWANEAVMAVYSFNFIDYRQALSRAQDYFTPEGWQQFLSSLQSSNTLAMVLSQKLIVTAVPTQAPVILDQGLLSGTYAWKIQEPVLVTYQSASMTQPQALTIVMTIERMSTLNNPKGVGISQFVAIQGGPPSNA